MNIKDKNFCPFIKDLCRADCVFKYHKVGGSCGIHSCLIAIQISEIDQRRNEVEYKR